MHDQQTRGETLAQRWADEVQPVCLGRAVMAWQNRTFPQKMTHYVEGLIRGFIEVVLAGDTSTINVITTPASGSGEPVLEYSREFARRSGLVEAVVDLE